MLLTFAVAFASPLHIERGRLALAQDRALAARENALLALEDDRQDWRAWHLYQTSCDALNIGPLCKADLAHEAQTEPVVDIVNTWFDVQAERADVDELEGTDHPELRALATGALQDSTFPEARAVMLLQAVQLARGEVEAIVSDTLRTFPEHPEILIGLWAEDDPTFEKPRQRVLKAGKKLKGRSVVELYRWLRLFEAARERERAAEVRAQLQQAGETVGSEGTPVPMTLDASFAAADVQIAAVARPLDREAALLAVHTRRQLLSGAFRQRLVLHSESQNPRSRLDRVTSEVLAGDTPDPKMLALACGTVRGEPCEERPDLAAVYAERAQRRVAEGDREGALIDIVVATSIRPWAPPAWYTLRAELQEDGWGAFVSRALAWELGGDEPEGGLGAGWPGPTDAGEAAAHAAVASFQEELADEEGPPYDLARALRTLKIDRKDRAELGRLAFLAFLDRDEAEQDALLKRLVEAWPQDPEAHIQLGVSLRRRGLWTEAEAAYRAAVALEDEHAHDHEQHTRIDTQGAHIHGGAEEEVVFDPPPPEAWTGLAVVLAHLDRFDEARAMLEHAEEHAYTGAFIELHRALVHEAAGERTLALEALERSLTTREHLDHAEKLQLRIVLDEEPLFDALRGTPAYRALLLRTYGRTGFTPPG